MKTITFKSYMLAIIVAISAAQVSAMQQPTQAELTQKVEAARAKVTNLQAEIDKLTKNGKDVAAKVAELAQAQVDFVVAEKAANSSDILGQVKNKINEANTFAKNNPVQAVGISACAIAIVYAAYKWFTAESLTDEEKAERKQQIKKDREFAAKDQAQEEQTSGKKAADAWQEINKSTKNKKSKRNR